MVNKSKGQVQDQGNVDATEVPYHENRDGRDGCLRMAAEMATLCSRAVLLDTY